MNFQFESIGWDNKKNIVDKYKYYRMLIIFKMDQMKWQQNVSIFNNGISFNID